MTIHKSNLVIITVHKGPVEKLKKTLRSIDAQICMPQHNIVIAKDISLYEIASFQKKNRTFIINKDRSIYNAMNIGMRNKIINNQFIIFINSGDIFFNKQVIHNVKKYFVLNKPIVGRQILYFKKNYFFIKNYFANKKNYLPHGSFFCPPKKSNIVIKSIKFDERHKIDADGIWMKKIIFLFKNSIKKINITIGILELGGISTNPSIKTVLHFAKIDLYSCIKEFLKLNIKLIFGQKLYYKIIYYMKYEQITK